MNIKFAYTILYVKDVAQTISFYKNVFGFEQKLVTPEEDYGEIKSGETILAFANFELGSSNLKDGFIESQLGSKPFGFELAFTTDNVGELMKKSIEHGAVEISKAVVKPWGQTVGYVRDINGFVLEICSPI